MVRAALIQMSTEYETRKNVVKAEGLVHEAAESGAQIICLQELFNTIYFPHELDPRHLELAEPIDGPTMEAMRHVARETGTVLIAPIYEKALDGLLYNTASVIAPDGELIGIYRKSHIPIVKVATLTGFEKYYFAPGDTGFATFPTPFDVTIGILICYDRHFPEGARILALNGAQIVFVPTATTGMSRYLWELELRAHAVDNVYYVGGVNRVGVDEGGSESHFYGSSIWVGPKGQIVSQASDETDEVLTADLDVSVIPQIRNDWGFFRDRRPDLYGQLST
jgi:beta-ureidopropionase